MERSEKTPSLADALRATPPTLFGVRCHTCVLLESMPQDDAVTFRAALANEEFSVPFLVRALGAAGYRSSRGSISRHRRGECVRVE